jgi:hypothetical protein
LIEKDIGTRRRLEAAVVHREIAAGDDVAGVEQLAAVDADRARSEAIIGADTESAFVDEDAAAGGVGVAQDKRACADFGDR